MEKVCPWCGQPSDRGRLKTEQNTRNPEEVPHQKVTKVSISSVKCSHYTLKNSRQLFFSNKSSCICIYNLTSYHSMKLGLFFH